MNDEHNNDSSKTSALGNAAKTIGGATILTGYALFKGGKLLINQVGNGVKKVYQTSIEDKEKYNEIKRIEEYAQLTKDELNSKQKDKEDKLNKEIARYGEICKLIKNELEPAKRYLVYYDESNINARVHNERSYHINSSNTVNGIEVTGTSLSAGGIAGAAAGGGAAALMTALGTASTGTALSSLSGAAFTHALLASFGGGSIASGGLGMAGGAVVLGSLITIPALAVAGVVADKQIEKAYTKAKAAESQIEAARKECQALFIEYDNAIASLHKVNKNFSIFNQMFTQIVDLSIMAASIPSMKADYRILLHMAIDVANNYMDIRMVDLDGHVNKGIEDDLKRILQESSQCSIRLDNFYETMSKKEQDLANSLPHATKENYDDEVEKMRTIIKERDITIENQHKTINEQSNTIKIQNEKIEKQKIHIDNVENEIKREKNRFNEYVEIAQKHTKELENKLSEIQSEKERIIAENKALELRQQEQKNAFPNSYKRLVDEAKDKYPHISDSDVIDFIASGNLSYEIFSSINSGDYSQIVMEYVKAVERLLVDVLIHKKWCGNVKSQKPLDEMSLYQLTQKYIISEKYKDNWDPEFADKLDKLRSARNPGAHKYKISEQKMNEVRHIVLGGGKKGLSKKGLLYYMSEELLK